MPGAVPVAVELPVVRLRLIGAPGLALDLFRRLLVNQGLELDETPNGIGADVVVLVEPRAEHWAEARASSLPMVMVVREQADDTDVLSAVLAGAEAVLHGDSAPRDVVSVLEEVAGGGTVLDPGQTRAVAGVARAAIQPAISLSRREGEILASIDRGESVKQTAAGLGISPKTVENIQSRLFRKLDVRNRAQAVARAHELGLL